MTQNIAVPQNQRTKVRRDRRATLFTKLPNRYDCADASNRLVLELTDNLLNQDTSLNQDISLNQDNVVLLLVVKCFDLKLYWATNK